MDDLGTSREQISPEEFQYLRRRVAELEKIAAGYRQAETVEKQQREILQRRTAALATMLEVTRAISSSLDLEEILLQVTEHLARLASADACTLSRWNKAADTVTTWLEWRREGSPLDPPGTVYALANFPATKNVLVTGQPVIIRISDDQADPTEQSFLRRLGLRTLLMLPLIASEGIIGLVELSYSRREPDFTPDDITLYRALSDQAAVAIEKASLYQENQQRLQEQTALREAGLIISSSLDHDDVLHRIVQQMGQVIDVTSAYLCDYSSDAAAATVLAQYVSPQAGSAEPSSNPGAGCYVPDNFPSPPGFFTRNGPGFLIQHWNDPDLDPARRLQMEQSGVKTVLSVPLRIKGRVMAYAELWESRQRRQFTDQEIGLVQGIAQQAAIAVENARLYRQAQQEIAERKLAEIAEWRQREALQESEERFRRAFEDAGIGMALVGLDGQYLEVNSVLCDILGYSEAELKAANFQALTHPEDLDISLRRRTLLNEGQERRFQIEKRYRHKNGDVVWVQLTVSLIRDSQGQPLYQVAQYQDITASKRMAEALEAERNLLRTLIDALPDYVYVKDTESRYVLYNKAVAGFKPSAGDLKDKTDFDFHPAELAAEYYADEQRIIELGLGLVNKEERTVTQDGEQKCILTTKVPLRDSTGAIIGLVGVGRDITDRKRAAEALQESETRYRTLFENSPIALWEVDASKIKSYLDRLRRDRIADLPGYIAQHPELAYRCFRLLRLVDANQAALKIYEARDRNALLAALNPRKNPGLTVIYERQLQHMAAGRRQIKSEALFYIFRGEEQCVNLHWTVAPGYEETYGKVLVSLVDITERRKAEETLQRYAERLTALHDIDRAILAVRSPREVAQAALSHIQHMIPCCRASVVSFDRKRATATVLAVWVLGEIRPAEALVTTEDEFEIEDLQRDQLYIVEDTQACAHQRPLDKMLFEEGVLSFVNVPLWARGELIGSLNLGSDRPGAFTAEHLDVAREVAASLALAVQQARLYEQTRQDAATKATLLNEVNHRIKNNLGAIAGILHVERRRAGVNGQTQCQNIITDLLARVNGLATAHNLLSANEWSDLLLTNLARQVITSALQVVPTDKRLHVHVSSSPILVSPKQANTLALVLNELTTNTIKYALGERRTGHLTVSIYDQENDLVGVEFRDDGPGYPESVLDRGEYHTGLYLVNSLVRHDLTGQITFANAPGAVATIRFKMSSQPAKER